MVEGGHTSMTVIAVLHSEQSLVFAVFAIFHLYFDGFGIIGGQFAHGMGAGLYR